MSDDPGSHAFRGPDPAQRGDVRPARPALRLLHLRHALVREPGLRAEGEASAVLLRAGRGRRGPRAGRVPASGGAARPRLGPGPGPAHRRRSASTAATTARTLTDPRSARPCAPGADAAPRRGAGRPAGRRRGRRRRSPVAFLARRRADRVGVPAGLRRSPMRPGGVARPARRAGRTLTGGPP